MRSGNCEIDGVTTVKRECGTTRELATLLVGILWLTPWATARPQRPAGGDFEWRFSLKQNQVAPSNITARNSCFKRHRFQVELQNLPFMRLLDSPTFSVNPRNQYSLRVEFDSTGFAAGEYQGAVLIKCATCRGEKGCTQDFQRLNVYMTIVAPEQAAALTKSGETKPAANRQRPGAFVPNRVLALIAPASPQAMAATAQELAAAYGLTLIEVYPLVSTNDGLVAFGVPGGTDVLGIVAGLKADHRVRAAQPDFVYETAVQNNDSLVRLQYGPRLIRADRLPPSPAGEGIKIAVIDTGIDTTDAELKGKVSELVDRTGNGFTPDIHGTMLAGIIAAEPGKDVGISGVAPRSQLLAIKACQPVSAQAIEAQCWSLTLAKGLDFAIQKGARIINLSVGGPQQDKLLTRLVGEAVHRGCVVVAAAGNNGPRGQPSFPAALAGVIAVTAVDVAENLYPDATRGEYISLAAPGVEIVSTGPGNTFVVSSGTSLAAAFVTGTAALLLQQQPGMSSQAVQALLEHTAKDLGPPGKDPQFGSGLVDACQAIAQLTGGRNLCR